MERQRGRPEGRGDGPALEQVRVVADLAERHQHVHDAEVGPGLEGVPGLAAGHVVLVQLPLPLAEPAGHQVLELGRQVLLDFGLEAAQEEGPQDAVQPLHDALVPEVGPARLDDVGEGCQEPRLELVVAGEDVGHEEVEERPELHQVVLQGGASEEEAPLGGEVEQRPPALRAPVLDHVGLVEDQKVPLLAQEEPGVLQREGVGRDADVEGVGLGPPLPLDLALLDGPKVGQDLRRGAWGR